MLGLLVVNYYSQIGLIKFSPYFLVLYFNQFSIKKI